MTPKATIDFEVRSPVDLNAAGVAVYAAHPETLPLCLVAIIPGHDKFIVWAPLAPTMPMVTKYLEDLFQTTIYTSWDCPEPLVKWVSEGGIVEAHNAEFEYYIWELCQHRFGWPVLPIRQVECAMARCATASLPISLDGAARVVGTPRKDPKGEGLIQRYCKQRKPTKDDPRRFRMDPEGYIDIVRYCAKDTVAEERLMRKVPDMIPSEKDLWRVHLLINYRGMYVDQQLIANARKIESEIIENIKKHLPLNTHGRFEGADLTRLEVFKEKLAEVGCKLDDLKADTVAKTIADPHVHNDAVTALKARQQVSKSSVKKFGAFDKRLAEDGRIHGCYFFHGASTGRWAGRGVQPQNLPRGFGNIDACIDAVKKGSLALLDKFSNGNPMQGLSNCVRAGISAPEGRTIMCSDYAAIEGRGVFWLAGDKQGIKDFADFDAGVGPEPYKVMGGYIYKVKPDDVDKGQRALGKQAILGCGYNMGPDRFLETCLGYGMDIDRVMAEHAVMSYRERYEAVKWLWRSTEKAAIAAVKSPGRVTKTCCGRVAYKKEGQYLKCRLPSGRVLYYWKPHLKMQVTPWGEKRPKLFYYGWIQKISQWGPIGTYGGHLVENITQAVARDIQAFAMMKLNDLGYEVILHTHDEIAVEIDEDYDDGDLARYNKIITTTPDWAEGFPVKAEGWIGKNYKKD